ENGAQQTSMESQEGAFGSNISETDVRHNRDPFKGDEKEANAENVRVLSVDKVTVEKIVLESSNGSREVLLTKNESSRKLSLSSETRSNVIKCVKNDRQKSASNDRFRVLENVSKSKDTIPKTIVSGSQSKLPVPKSRKNNGVSSREESRDVRDRLEKSQATIDDLQKNLSTKIHASTAQSYKEKLLGLQSNYVLKPPIILESNCSERLSSGFDKDFLERHNLDKRLKIEEKRLLETDLDYTSDNDRTSETDERPSSKIDVKRKYSAKVTEVEKRWSGNFLDNRLQRNSSESSKSSYIEEFDSVSSRESIVEDRNAQLLFDRKHPEARFTKRRTSIDESKRRTSEEILENSTVSTVDSDSCLEDRIKAVDEDIAQEILLTDEKNILAEKRNNKSSNSFTAVNSKESIDPTTFVVRSHRGRDGYANLIKEFAMEAGSSKVKKEEKQKKKLGFRRLLPAIFSPKDSRKDYKKKEQKERRRYDERHFARYQQNGNYTRSPDTMNLNEDIKRNVKLDNSLNGSIIEERLDEIKRELFPEQGPITSTPDHFLQTDDTRLLRERTRGPRSYTANSSLSSIAPDDRWLERSGQFGVSPDIRKYEQRQRREQHDSRRYGHLERKHSLQESNQGARVYLFQRNHGASGRISAPPGERYYIRSRAIHPVDRPLPEIPQSRLELSNYENYQDDVDQLRENLSSLDVTDNVSYRSQSGLYQNDRNLEASLIHSPPQSVPAQVKITRQPIVNQNQKAPLVGRTPKYPSSGSSQKSGDYADSSCTPNSSQKSEFSPSSSKSGEYYLNSPRSSARASPADRPLFEDARDRIYENEGQTVSEPSNNYIGEHLYDETPSSPCHDDDFTEVSNCITQNSPEKKDDLIFEQKCSPNQQSPTKNLATSPVGCRARRSQPDDQILIASPKRDAICQSRISRPSNEVRLRDAESPVPIADSRGISGIVPIEVRNHPQSCVSETKQIVNEPGKKVARSPIREPSNAAQDICQQRRPDAIQQQQAPLTAAALTLEGRQSSPSTSQDKMYVSANSLQREPIYEQRQRQHQPQQLRQGQELYAQRITDATCGQQNYPNCGLLSPSKQETRQHLEAFYWQQKALEAHRKSANSGPRQIAPKIDLPEMREAVYWQQLKRLDEEQQRRIYEQNLTEDGLYETHHKARNGSPMISPALPNQVFNSNALGSVIHRDGSYWSNAAQRLKVSPTGKPLLMQVQKGQNQPVLIVRPQQALRDRQELSIKAINPRDLAGYDTQRSKSASPHFHRGDIERTSVRQVTCRKSVADGRTDTASSPARKLEVGGVYEEDGTDGDVRSRPHPIFKRGSLIGGESAEYGSTGPKRVSFSNQPNTGPDLTAGNWPTKRGTAPEPPTRRHRTEDSTSDTDSVFLHQDRHDGTQDVSYVARTAGPSPRCRSDGSCSEQEYDANKPLPPLPKDSLIISRRGNNARNYACNDARWNSEEQRGCRRKQNEAERIPIVDDGRRYETARSRGGATCVRRYYASAASNDASRVATCQLRFVNVRGAYSRATNARAVFAPDDATLETLRRKLRKMLIGRWKSKDKSSSKSSSSSGAGKKKRKFGREGRVSVIQVKTRFSDFAEMRIFVWRHCVSLDGKKAIVSLINLMASAEESAEVAEGPVWAMGPVGTERDGERKREQGVAGGVGEGESRRCGGSGWMQEDCARRVRKREGGYRAGGGGGGRGGSGFGATAMSVCTRTPSRPRRWRNVATQPHRKPVRPHRQAAPGLDFRSFLCDVASGECAASGVTAAPLRRESLYD
ncbi:hypothetical protein ALC56_12849, partial [Trachymyrmex septentrionalis]